MKVAIQFLSLFLLFNCLQSINCEPNLVTLEVVKDSYKHTVDTVFMIDKDYYNDAYYRIFKPCSKSKERTTEIGDNIIRVDCKCEEVAILRGFQKLGWKVQPFYTSNFGNGFTTTYWSLTKEM